MYNALTITEIASQSDFKRWSAKQVKEWATKEVQVREEYAQMLLDNDVDGESIAVFTEADFAVACSFKVFFCQHYSPSYFNATTVTPKDWTKEEVFEWANTHKNQDVKDLSVTFKEQDIDGASLSNLTIEVLRSFGLTFGKSNTLYSAIQTLIGKPTIGISAPTPQDLLLPRLDKMVTLLSKMANNKLENQSHSVSYSDYFYEIKENISTGPFWLELTKTKEPKGFGKNLSSTETKLHQELVKQFKQLTKDTSTLEVHDTSKNFYLLDNRSKSQNPKAPDWSFVVKGMPIEQDWVQVVGDTKTSANFAPEHIGQVLKYADIILNNTCHKTTTAFLVNETSIIFWMVAKGTGGNSYRKFGPLPFHSRIGDTAFRYIYSLLHQPVTSGFPDDVPLDIKRTSMFLKEGASSTVYSAIHEEKEVVLKIYKQEQDRLKEYQALKDMPNIHGVSSIILHGNEWSLITPVGDVLSSEEFTPNTFEKLVRILQQVHHTTGRVHRDIRSPNIVMANDGPGEREMGVILTKEQEKEYKRKRQTLGPGYHFNKSFMSMDDIMHDDVVFPKSRLKKHIVDPREEFPGDMVDEKKAGSLFIINKQQHFNNSIKDLDQKYQGGGGEESGASEIKKTIEITPDDNDQIHEDHSRWEDERPITCRWMGCKHPNLTVCLLHDHIKSHLSALVSNTTRSPKKNKVQCQWIKEDQSTCGVNLDKSEFAVIDHIRGLHLDAKDGQLRKSTPLISSSNPKDPLSSIYLGALGFPPTADPRLYLFKTRDPLYYTYIHAALNENTLLFEYFNQVTQQ
ncbi:putative protein serine/threonine kinase [Cavenderia fasciculata]|uniref:SAM domain-containing protein n=1 Tax=Cavenderia fasciculata TaxID=261658 RepID=F4Q423_CACFS|nr:putative protein serine/threonine kinase [Cavenderia fasciculata]EGG16937.1 putative protein serine/threonine kinase [Cavenderia fasciculata]|eukprot:XP_004355411.1 putative protein serine/threonine kinase [Cavenderia fasciculata]